MVTTDSDILFRITSYVFDSVSEPFNIKWEKIVEFLYDKNTLKDIVSSQEYKIYLFMEAINLMKENGQKKLNEFKKAMGLYI